jgi:hypothetical protein
MTLGEPATDVSTRAQLAARRKNGKAHVVHLSEPAQFVPRAMSRGEEGTHV